MEKFKHKIFCSFCSLIYFFLDCVYNSPQIWSHWKDRRSEIFTFFIILVHCSFKLKSNLWPKHVVLLWHAPQFRGGVSVILQDMFSLEFDWFIHKIKLANHKNAYHDKYSVLHPYCHLSSGQSRWFERRNFSVLVELWGRGLWGFWW